MLTLGINYGSHDSAAAIACEGKILFAIAEERLSRKKHDGGFPVLAITAALSHAGAKLADVDEVAFGWQPSSATRTADFRNYLTGAHPMRLSDVLRGQGIGWFEDYRKNGERLFRRHIGAPRNGFKRIDHHYAHALSAYPVSGFDEATIVVVDGRGAWEATSIWHGRGGKLRLLEMVRWPNSLGLFYAEFTAWLGFERYQDEWKVMGLAPYGGPGVNLGKFISVSKGGYRSTRGGCSSRGMMDRDLAGIERELGPARDPDQPIQMCIARDVAWAVQDACERAEIAVISRAIAPTGCKNVCLAGGVALNSKANGLFLSRNWWIGYLFSLPLATTAWLSVRP